MSPELLSLLSTSAIVISGVCLVIGVILIRRGARVAHHRTMLTASTFALIFLIVYLTRWALFGSTSYGGPQAWAVPYYILLTLHIILAAANVPLAAGALFRAFRSEFDQHRVWARITVPVWLFVAVSGWVIYLVLDRYGVESGEFGF